VVQLVSQQDKSKKKKKKKKPASLLVEMCQIVKQV